LHQYSRKIVDQYQSIYVGDVNSRKLVKTRMAKSVLDAGWGMLKTLLQCKGQQAAEAFESSARKTQRAPAAAVGPSPDPQVWPCVL